MIEFSKEELRFILNMFGQTTVKVSDPNSVEVCNFVRSITNKIETFDMVGGE